MRKTHFILCLAILCILLSACKKDEKINYSELLQGTWVNTMVNGKPLLTDDTFVMELKSDRTEMYAIGIKMDDNNKTWKENSSYRYTVNGDLITINGVNGVDSQLKMRIKSLKDGILTFTVEESIFNGKSVPDDKTYTLTKVNTDNKKAFTGVWYGKCTTPGTADSLYHYWEYFDDGSFNYYYQDKNNKWIKKSDNQGKYFLYGQFMVANYSHDLLSGGQGLAFEGWNYSIEGNKMIWTGLRQNNVTITYEMEKVPAPPKV